MKFSKTFAMNILIAAFAAFTSVLIARLFGPETRGQYAAFTALANSAAMLAALGTQTTLARIVASQEKSCSSNDLDLPRTLFGVICVSTMLSLAIIAALNWNSQVIDSNAFSHTSLTLYVALSITSLLLLNISVGQANWLNFNISRLSFALVAFVIIGAYGWFGGQSLNGIVVALTISNLFTVGIQLYFLNALSRTKSRLINSTISVYYRSRKYALNSLANVSTGYADVLVCAALFKPSVVGYWAVARTISALLSPLNSAISITVFSAFARRDQETSKAFTTVVTKFFVINLILVVFLLYISELVVVNLFGYEFIESVPLVPLALLAVIGASLSEIFEERLRGAGRPGPVTISRLIPLIALVIVFLFDEYVTTIWFLGLIFALSQLFRSVVAFIFYIIIELDNEDVKSEDRL